MSICSTRLKDDPTLYYVVGTALVGPEESEPKQGRIILFSFTDGKLQQVGVEMRWIALGMFFLTYVLYFFYFMCYGA